MNMQSFKNFVCTNNWTPLLKFLDSLLDKDSSTQLDWYHTSADSTVIPPFTNTMCDFHSEDSTGPRSPCTCVQSSLLQQLGQEWSIRSDIYWWIVHMRNNIVRVILSMIARGSLIVFIPSCISRSMEFRISCWEIGCVHSVTSMDPLNQLTVGIPWYKHTHTHT